MATRSAPALPPADPLALDQQLCFPLYAASHLMTRLYRPLLAPLGLTLWLAVGVAWAPPPVTHALVIRLSLALSGHERPYTRAHLHATPKTRVPARSWPPAGETDLA